MSGLVRPDEELVKGGPFDTDRALDPAIEANVRARYHLDWPDLEASSSTTSGRFNLDERGAASADRRRARDARPRRRADGRLRALVPVPGLHGRTTSSPSRCPISALLGTVAMMWALALGISTGIASALRRGERPRPRAAARGDGRDRAAELRDRELPDRPVRLPPAALPGRRLGLGAPHAAARLLPRPRVRRLRRAADPYRDARSARPRTTSARRTRRGSSPRTVVLRHALKGGLLPVVSYLGPATAGILTGQPRDRAHLLHPRARGSHFINSAINRDYTLAMGVTILYTVLVYSPQHGRRPRVHAARPARSDWRSSEWAPPDAGIWADRDLDQPARAKRGEHKGESLWHDAWRRLRRNRRGVALGDPLPRRRSRRSSRSSHRSSPCRSPVEDAPRHAGGPEGTAPRAARSPAGRRRFPRARRRTAGRSTPERRSNARLLGPHLPRPRPCVRAAPRPSSATGRPGSWMGTDHLGRDILATHRVGQPDLDPGRARATACSLLIGVPLRRAGGPRRGPRRQPDDARRGRALLDALRLRRHLPHHEHRATTATAARAAHRADREKVFYLVIGAIYWLTMARVVRGQVLSLRETGVHRAPPACSGPRRSGILKSHHLVPNVTLDRRRLPHADDPGGHALRGLPLVPRPRRSSRRR